MKRFVALLVSLILGVSTLLFAGDEKGNGGDVVVCRSGSGAIQSIEMLDLYEGREYYGIKANFGSSHFNYKQQLAFVMGRFEKVDPDRAKVYLQRIASFESEALFKPGVVLVDIPDSLHLFIPSGCAIEQIAIQKAPQYANEKRYTVNKDLWDRLDEVNKAVLILHEVVYREAIERGHQNSRAARYFNASLWSMTLGSLNPTEYFDFLKKIDFLGALIKYKFEFIPGKIDYHEDGSVRVGQLVKPYSIMVGPNVFNLVQGSKIYFHKGGSVEKIEANGLMQIKVGTRSYWVGRSEVSFYPGGQVREAYLVGPDGAYQDTITVGREKFLVRDRTEFYENGAVKFAHCSGLQRKVTVGFKTVFFEDVSSNPYSAQLAFSESGEITEIGAVMITNVQKKGLVVTNTRFLEKEKIMRFQLGANGHAILLGPGEEPFRIRPEQFFCIGADDLVVTCPGA